MSLFERKEATGVWWRDHSLSLVIGTILAIQTAVSLWTGRAEWSASADSHTEFWRWWLYEYTTSVVADTYGVLLIVLLSKWFVERGSVESKE